MCEMLFFLVYTASGLCVASGYMNVSGECVCGGGGGLEKELSS